MAGFWWLVVLYINIGTAKRENEQPIGGENQRATKRKALSFPR